MFAIVDIAGFQEKVEEGDQLLIPLQSAEEGSVLTFDRVLLLETGNTTPLVGLPLIQGASVEVKILRHGRAEKIRVVKAHRRKRYRRLHGHRQPYTQVEVTKIKTDGSSPSRSEVAAGPRG